MRAATLLVLLCVLPSAHALSIDVSPPAAVALTPDIPLEASLTVAVRCDEPMDVVRTGTRYLSHTMTTEHEALLAQPRERMPLPDELCVTSDEAVLEVAFGLVGSMGAPGGQPLDVHHQFVVVDEADAQVSVIAVATQEATLAYTGDISLRTSTSLKVGGPQKQLAYDITVENHGNARSVVRWELLHDDLAGQVVLPAELILEPAGSPQASATTTVIYATPFKNGPNQALENFTIRATPFNARDAGETGTPAEIELAARTRGVYVPSPTALLPVALLGAALLRRR